MPGIESQKAFDLLEQRAEKLFVSPLTVRAHVHRAMTKLGRGTGLSWW